jgi:hypothetical protein
MRNTVATAAIRTQIPQSPSSQPSHWTQSTSGHCKLETYLLPPEFEPRYLSHPARSLVTIWPELFRLLLEVLKIKIERQDCQIVFTLTERWRILSKQSKMKPLANMTGVAEWRTIETLRCMQRPWRIGNRCIGKAISITHSECVTADLSIQHAMRVPHFVVCGLSDSAMFFHIIS